MIAVKLDSKEKKWSKPPLTFKSGSLDLEDGIFGWSDPRRIASSLRDAAEKSQQRKLTPFRAAMAMLVFYINRAGDNLDREQKKVLEQAKVELRRLYGRLP